jgi:hypothetical protein
MAGLFDYQSPENMRAARLDPLLVSPAQMGQQPLLSQLVSQMSNAGANLGSAGAGMLGLQLPEEAAQQRVKDIMQGVAQDDVEGLKAASQKFADIGDTQRANALMGRANEAETLGFARQDRKTAQDQIKAAATQKESLITALTKRDPNMSPEVAAVLAGDSKALLSYLNPDVKTAFKEVNGRIVLFNSDTGIPIRDVGAATNNRPQVNINTLTESSYNREAGPDIYKSDKLIVTEAKEAQKLLPNMYETLKVIKTGDINTGIGSQVFDVIRRAQSQFLNDKKAKVNVSDSQYLDSLLGKAVFGQIAALGIGARGLDTPAERDFLLEVVTGKRSLDKESLVKITENRIATSERAVKTFNDALSGGELDRIQKVTGKTYKAYELSKPAPTATLTDDEVINKHLPKRGS